MSPTRVFWGLRGQKGSTATAFASLKQSLRREDVSLRDLWSLPATPLHIVATDLPNGFDRFRRSTRVIRRSASGSHGAVHRRAIQADQSQRASRPGRRSGWPTSVTFQTLFGTCLPFVVGHRVRFRAEHLPTGPHRPARVMAADSLLLVSRCTRRNWTAYGSIG